MRSSVIVAACLAATSSAGFAQPGSTMFIPGLRGPEASVRFHAPLPNGVALFRDGAIVLCDRGREPQRIVFPGSRAQPTVRAEAPLETVVNYLVGNPSEHRARVPTYGRLRYADLWPGVDLVVSAMGGALKYEFAVAPGADSGCIRMRYVGATLSVLPNGDLEIRAADDTTRRDAAPVSYQTIDARRVDVASSFVVRPGAPDTLAFDVSAHDRAHPLVVDPAFVTFGGYAMFGLPTVDVAADPAGTAVLVGTGMAQDIYGDVVVAKVKPDGSAFEFITYLGAPNSTDAGVAIAVDATGIYIGGVTATPETSFPVKIGPMLKHGGGNDMFVCKLSPDGQTIVYCGYIGGTGSEGLRDLVVDSTGAVIVGGQTTSGDYPVVRGPQLSKPALQPACVSKVAPDGRTLVFSGYLGGSDPSLQYVVGLAVDANDDCYATGITGSDERSFPVRTGPGRTKQGLTDVFVAKIRGQSGAIVYAGYIGSALYDQALQVAVDSRGAAYVTGWTNDPNTFPNINGIPNLVSSDFVAKVRPDGSALEFATFLGGIRPIDIAVGSTGRCDIAGQYQPTASPPPFPVGGALSSVYSATDIVLARLAPDGKSFDYVGFHGGSSVDGARSIALGPTGEIFMSGQTVSPDFPIRIGPSRVYSGGLPTVVSGAFVMRVAQVVAGAPLRARPGAVFSIDCIASDDSGLPFQVGTALGGGPIVVPGQRRIDLSPDPVLATSVAGRLPTVFRNYTGAVPVNGRWASTVQLPPIAALVGTSLFTAFVTFAPGYPGGIKSISNSAPTTVVP